MSTWLNQLFSCFDKSKDGKLSIEELIIYTSPSVGILYKECNKVYVPVVITQAKSREIGMKATRIFLAKILHNVPSALNDGFIDLNKIHMHAAKSEDIKLFTDENTEIPTKLGKQLLSEVDIILARMQ